MLPQQLPAPLFTLAVLPAGCISVPVAAALSPVPPLSQVHYSVPPSFSSLYACSFTKLALQSSVLFCPNSFTCQYLLQRVIDLVQGFWSTTNTEILLRLILDLLLLPRVGVTMQRGSSSRGRTLESSRPLHTSLLQRQPPYWHPGCDHLSSCLQPMGSAETPRSPPSFP